MADEHDAQREAAKRQLAMDREVSERSRAEFVERMKGKPTPTQEENDMAALGSPVFEKEDDGSGPEPTFVMTRQVEGGKPGVYQTRQATPATPKQPVSPSSRSSSSGSST